MSKLVSLEERKKRWTEAQTYGTRIVICAGTGCVAGGSLKIYAKFKEALKQRGMSVAVALEKEKADFGLAETGCKGFCQMGPLVTIKPLGVLYTKVAEEDVDEIIDKTLKSGEVIERLLYKCPHDSKKVEKQDDIPFYKSQVRLMLDMCGSIDVNDVDEYVAGDGYFMARKAVLDMNGKQICDEILASGLRGRGGGGFPTGRKWEFARVNQSDVKYVICNGDEGDPGAFMDRCIMEGNPHAVLEGMIITAAAIGASEGIIYVRMEYPLAVRRLKAAIKQAREAGFIGKNIFGSKMNFDVEIMEGAGAFVCGEETALMASVEGRRGMPTLKPPFPAEKGLFGKPTIINNVETLAAVPVIMRMGPAEYAKFGTEKSKGTKVFALTGHIANSGLIEVPFGMTLRKIVGEIGGGVIGDDGEFLGALEYKAVQIGGPSGGCLTQKHLDMPIDYDGLIAAGAMVGSGGLVVMNKKTCIVKIAQYFMQFTQNESCGKCTPCREGTRQMLELLKKITDGKAEMEDLKLLEELAQTVMVSSLCMLGKTAPNPVISTLEHFRDEYLAHVVHKKCPVNACEALMSYKITDACKGCTLCVKKCPVEAITGERGKLFSIDRDKCIKCNACVDACKFKAIIRG